MSSPRPVVEAENRLERFNADRDGILSEVERRIMAATCERAERGGDASLEYVINEVAFAEMRRLDKATSRGGQKAFQRWRELANRLSRMSDEEKRGELQKLVSYYARDVVGNFNPRVYRFASDVMPPLVSVLLSPISSWRSGLAALGEFEGHLQVEGPLDVIRDACDRGTVVVTPTHSSNLDSIVLALGLKLNKLPPVTYGAGKNLFTNPFISYFMHNLGAYRVDRRLRFSLYKAVLKQYSSVLLERGYHSLFFPGGTRSRSNMVEHRLKLGLLGTALTAYQNSLRSNGRHRRMYVVPVTINYRLVLEAETLIDDYLADDGKSRYIIEDDEFSRFGRLLEFMRKTLALEDAVHLRFGMPMDVFGNQTDVDGNSLDRRGRVVDPASYVTDANGNVVDDPQRDAEYTRILGRSLGKAFQRDTVFHATSLVSRAAFDEIAAKANTRDIYRLLRLPASELVVSAERVRAGVARLQDRIRTNPELGNIHEREPAEVVRDAIAGLVTYHTRRVLAQFGDEIRVGDMKLLFYYQNRTSHIAPETGA
jgi:glycerol-3-phosphate O-acyltransferase